MNIIKLNKMKHTPAVICGRMPFINELLLSGKQSQCVVPQIVSIV